MKITLILTASLTDPLRKNDPFMPLSLPILAGSAPGHEYHFVDLLWEDGVDVDRPADLVGMSVRLTAEKRAYEIADEFRKRGVKVVMGGPQVSAVPMRAIGHADAVVIGEGELLWPRVVRDAGEGKLKDFYVCSPQPFDGGGRSVHQIDGYVDLSLPIRPARGLYRKKYTFDTVFAARGCAVNCDFCSVTGLFGSRTRTRPIAEVVAEIDTFRNYYYLLDDTVFGRPDTYGYYLELYRAISGLKKKRFWTGQANLEAAADPEGRKVIEEAARSGLIYAAVGIESINPATLRSSGALAKLGVRSGEDAVEKIREGIRFIQSLGIIVSGWFVMGYEEDTLETYYRTLEFCLETNILPAIFPVKVMPGTRLHDRLSREGKLDDSRLINFTHASIKDEEVFEALRTVRKRGYSLGRRMKRSRFYLGKFREDKIHRSIFLMILQSRIGGGLDISRDEFYQDRPAGGAMKR